MNMLHDIRPEGVFVFVFLIHRKGGRKILKKKDVLFRGFIQKVESFSQRIITNIFYGFNITFLNL
jgi:hypothetical protein